MTWKVTHGLSYLIGMQLFSAKHTFGIAVSPDPSSLSTWKGRDQTMLSRTSELIVYEPFIGFNLDFKMTRS